MASSSSSSRLEISLETPPPDRDPVTGRPQILYDYADGGVPIWKQEESSEELLGKTVRRIWEEKGGLVNFTQLELNDKINREEQRGGDVELDNDNEGGLNADEVTNQLPPREIDPEEMKAFKFQIAERLHQASYSLEHFHYLITLLLPSTSTNSASTTPSHALPPGVPFPPSSFSTTHTLPIPPAPIPPLDHLAEKQAALRATVDMFKTSGEELRDVVKRAEGEWEVALGVRELGGWAVGLRGAERGFMGETSGNRDARDWVGWYGLDAAPPSFRVRHYAHLPAPDAFSPSSSSSSSSTQPKLVFPNRTRRRLQVTIARTFNGGSVISSSSECLTRPSASSDPSEAAKGGEEVDGGKEAAKDMEEAMWEAVEEETFAEIIAEARQLVQTLPSRITYNAIKIEVSPGLELTISLIIPAPTFPPADSSSSSSAYPTLLSSYLTLSLLSLHAHRSTHLALASQPVRDPRAFSSSNPNSSRPKILQPLVEVVQFQGLEERVRGLVQGLVEGLGGNVDAKGNGKGKEREGKKGGIGMRARVEWEGEDRHGWEPVETGGRSGVRVREEGRKGVLWLEDCPPITIQILPPLRLNLLVPNRSSSNNFQNPSQPKPKTNTVTITDLVHLASLLELEVKEVLLQMLARIGKEDVDAGEGRGGKRTTEGFVDRLQGVALLQWEKGEIRFEPLVTLTTSTFLPSIHIRAMVRSTSDPEGKEVVFESGGGSGKEGFEGVWQWARGVWRSARS